MSELWFQRSRYDEKIRADAVDDARHTERDTLPEFVLDFMANEYEHFLQYQSRSVAMPPLFVFVCAITIGQSQELTQMFMYGCVYN